MVIRKAAESLRECQEPTQQNRGSKTSEKLKSNFMEIILLEWNCTKFQSTKRREILTERCIVFIEGEGGRGRGEDDILVKAKITLGNSCKDNMQGSVQKPAVG